MFDTRRGTAVARRSALCLPGEDGEARKQGSGSRVLRRQDAIMQMEKRSGLMATKDRKQELESELLVSGHTGLGRRAFGDGEGAARGRERLVARQTGMEKYRSHGAGGRRILLAVALLGRRYLEPKAPGQRSDFLASSGLALPEGLAGRSKLHEQCCRFAEEAWVGNDSAEHVGLRVLPAS